MRADVDQDLCIGCGVCPDICPDVFELQEDDKAHVISDECEDGECCIEARDSCPVDAINIFD